MDNLSTRIKSIQTKRLLAVIVGVMAIIVIVVEAVAPKPAAHSSVETQRFSSALNNGNGGMRSAWLEHFQTEVQHHEEALVALQAKVAEWEKAQEADKTEKGEERETIEKTAEPPAVSPAGVPPVTSAEASGISTAVPVAASVPGAVSASANALAPSAASQGALDGLSEPITASGWQGQDVLPVREQVRKRFAHAPHADNIPNPSSESYANNTKTPENYVPTGTHVLGVLLMGAEVVNSDYDQANPKPILIRLISDGRLPNHHRSHLKGCVVTGAMTGEISSGRGNVRLERLSCVRANGHILEVPVTGVVATYAKEGIMGQSYSREGGRVAGATVAGTLAGMAGVAQSLAPKPGGAGGSGNEAPWNAGAMATYAGAQGATSGLNRLSEFELNRAERLHPVITVNGGVVVTVVFTQQGFYVDERDEEHPGDAGNPAGGEAADGVDTEADPDPDTVFREAIAAEKNT